MEKITNEQQYYIKHFSQMTCMSFYFMSNDKQNLLNNENLIDEYINVEYKYYDEILKKLKDKNISMYCDEFENFDKKMIKNAICIKKYSYRF